MERDESAKPGTPVKPGLRRRPGHGAYGNGVHQNTAALIPSGEEGYVVLEAISSLAAEQAQQLGLEVGLRLPVADTSLPSQACAMPRHCIPIWHVRVIATVPCLKDWLRKVPPRVWPYRYEPAIVDVGILQSACSRPSGFTRDQIQLMYLVADVLGPAISNCQLFGRLRTAYEELRTTQIPAGQAEKIGHSASWREAWLTNSITRSVACWASWNWSS